MTVTDASPVLHRITLQLAREKGRPAGDPANRYVLIAPLDLNGSVDTELWRDHRDRYRVVHDDGRDTLIGHLVHGPGGQWSIHYDVTGVAADETVFRPTEERLRPGEYVSIVQGDAEHAFRVVSVNPV